MSDTSVLKQKHSSQLSRDFWTFWVGQTVSNFGTSFTLFVIPLLVLKLTNSPLSLGISTAISFVSYLLFGFVIGAWVDRVNRKRLMIITDLLRGLIVVSVPTLFALNLLTVWWLYVVSFLSTTLAICFDASEFAAIPSLVKKDQLITANGRITGSYSVANAVGPVLAGVFVALMPLPTIMLFDALSFLVSVVSLALIRVSFNVSQPEKRTLESIGQDVREGLRYILGNPLLRTIAIMMALVNFLSVTIIYQIATFARLHYLANYSQVAWFYAAGGIGVATLALSANFLRKHLSFGVVALGALMLNGLLTALMALTPWYWAGLLLWGCIWGLANLFNINANSLRQAIVPNTLLGRVRSSSAALAWCALPIGSLLGGILIERTGNISLVYAIGGLLIFLLALSFSFSAIGHAHRYLSQKASPPSTETKTVEASS